MKGVKIIGADPENGRSHLDFYPTPPEVTRALLDVLDIQTGQTILECAAGDGDMADVLEQYGYSVIRSDIRTGTDFLADTEPRSFDWIITNPPFSLAEQFIRKCASYKKPFALLLKSQYWHAKTRLPLFKEFTPARIYPLTWRPNFKFKEREKSSPLMDVMWCVWMPDKKNYSMYMPIGRTEK